MEKLNKLIKCCKGSVNLDINSHKDSYETVEQYFKNPILSEYLEDVENDVYLKMIELDTIIELIFYPDTPIGSYAIYHYDIEKAIDIAMKTLNIK